MKSTNSLRISSILTIIIFSFEIILFSPDIYPQSINQIEDRIGGGGTANSSEDSNNDNTFLYIAAGAIVVGLIVWKVFLNKKEPKSKDEIKTDSTKASLDKYFYKNLSDRELQVEKIRDHVPLEIFLGLKKNEHSTPGNNLSLGLKIKL